MKKKILLVDESVTVQKVVSLTLDKAVFTTTYAKSKAEAMTHVTTTLPDLILVSEQVPEINASAFPKEVETWLGRRHAPPPMILITGQDIKEMRHYAGVLKKPFSPQVLSSLVQELTEQSDSAVHPRMTESDSSFHGRFNETFNDEAQLVRETFEESVTPVRKPQTAASDENLWVAPAPLIRSRQSASPDIMRSPTENLAYKAALESQVQGVLEKGELTEVVSEVLDRILPPLVEKLVQERLDKLLKDQEVGEFGA